MLSNYAAKVLRQRSEEIPPLEMALEAADCLGSVEIKRGWRIGAFECEILLRDELAAPHYLMFRGHGDTRAAATANAISEAMVYVETRHGSC